MIPLHELLPEVAQREVRCVLLGPGEGSGPPPDEYAYVELYCEDLACDCRRVVLQVIAKEQPGKVFATINFGWEKESFYQKRLGFDQDGARAVILGSLDPINEQSEFAEFFLETFQDVVLDMPYRLRLRRHYLMFKEELRRRAVQKVGASKAAEGTEMGG
jgi:hypothetical protein